MVTAGFHKRFRKAVTDFGMPGERNEAVSDGSNRSRLRNDILASLAQSRRCQLAKQLD
jgi:hypothetical protein